jgi:hypothetical protein
LSQKKRSLAERLSGLVGLLALDMAAIRFRGQIYRFIRRIISALLVAVVGVFLIVIGFAYALWGVAQLLATVIPDWAAFILLGLILLGLGFVLTRLRLR